MDRNNKENSLIARMIYNLSSVGQDRRQRVERHTEENEARRKDSIYHTYNVRIGGKGRPCRPGSGNVKRPFIGWHKNWRVIISNEMGDAPSVEFSSSS